MDTWDEVKFSVSSFSYLLLVWENLQMFFYPVSYLYMTSRDLLN